MPESITLAELIRAAIDSRLMDLHVAMPGKVQSYDAAKQTCDVIPQLDRAVPDDEGGYELEQLPVLPNVPVCFPRGGGFFASFPLAKGDFVLVVFAERAIGTWRDRGDHGDPADLRLHPLAGAIAIPGVYPSAQALQSADASDMMVGKDGGALIRIRTNGDIVLNGGTAGVARVGDPSGNHLHAAGTLVAGPYPVTGATALTNPTIPENGVKVKA